MTISATRENVVSQNLSFWFPRIAFRERDSNTWVTGSLVPEYSFWINGFDYDNRTIFSGGYGSSHRQDISGEPVLTFRLCFRADSTISDLYQLSFRFQFRTIDFIYGSSDGSLLESEKQEGESASNSANNSVQDHQDSVNDKFDGVQNGFSSLISGLTTSSTTVDLFKLPAMYIPATSVTPRIALTEEQSINLNEWVSNVENNAPKLIVVVRYILTIALFLFAGYEVINLIDTLVNGRKINPDKPDGGDDS